MDSDHPATNHCTRTHTHYFWVGACHDTRYLHSYSEVISHYRSPNASIASSGRHPPERRGNRQGGGGSESGGRNHFPWQTSLTIFAGVFLVSPTKCAQVQGNYVMTHFETPGSHHDDNQPRVAKHLGRDERRDAQAGSPGKPCLSLPFLSLKS